MDRARGSLRVKSQKTQPSSPPTPLPPQQRQQRHPYLRKTSDLTSSQNGFEGRAVFGAGPVTGVLEASQPAAPCETNTTASPAVEARSDPSLFDAAYWTPLEHLASCANNDAQFEDVYADCSSDEEMVDDIVRKIQGLVQMVEVSLKQRAAHACFEKRVGFMSRASESAITRSSILVCRSNRESLAAESTTRRDSSRLSLRDSTPITKLLELAMADMEVLQEAEDNANVEEEMTAVLSHLALQEAELMDRKKMIEELREEVAHKDSVVTMQQIEIADLRARMAETDAECRRLHEEHANSYVQACQWFRDVTVDEGRDAADHTKQMQSSLQEQLDSTLSLLKDFSSSLVKQETTQVEVVCAQAAFPKQKAGAELIPPRVVMRTATTPLRDSYAASLTAPPAQAGAAPVVRRTSSPPVVLRTPSATWRDARMDPGASPGQLARVTRASSPTLLSPSATWRDPRIDISASPGQPPRVTRASSPTNVPMSVASAPLSQGTPFGGNFSLLPSSPSPLPRGSLGRFSSPQRTIAE